MWVLKNVAALAAVLVGLPAIGYAMDGPIGMLIMGGIALFITRKAWT